jgi:hypothetical protein
LKRGYFVGSLYIKYNLWGKHLKISNLKLNFMALKIVNTLNEKICSNIMEGIK